MFYKINDLIDLYFILPNGTSNQKIYEHFIKYSKYKQCSSRKFTSGLYCLVFYDK